MVSGLLVVGASGELHAGLISHCRCCSYVVSECSCIRLNVTPRCQAHVAQVHGHMSCMTCPQCTAQVRGVTPALGVGGAAAVLDCATAMAMQSFSMRPWYACRWSASIGCMAADRFRRWGCKRALGHEVVTHVLTAEEVAGCHQTPAFLPHMACCYTPPPARS